MTEREKLVEQLRKMIESVNPADRVVVLMGGQLASVSDGQAGAEHVRPKVGIARCRCGPLWGYSPRLR